MRKTAIKSSNKRKKKQRVAAYCRVSTEKGNQQNSFEAQQVYFQKAYANSDTAELVEIYTDNTSGTSALYRPGFQRMIADCQAGKIDRIVTKSLSRFARNTKDCLTALREMKKIGVTVQFEKEGIDTANVSDEIMITIMEGLAQEESASISRNIRWSLKRRMANGTLGIARVPYGYIKVDGQLEIDESKAKIIKRIFALYLSGTGAKRIADKLNDDGIPSPTNTKWNNITILKILRQEKYIGDIRWQKTYSTFMGAKWKINRGEQESYYIRDCLTPIISRDDFTSAQALRERNTRQQHKTNASPFRGKTKCTCGRSFYLKNGLRPVWECTGKYSPVNTCQNPVFFDADYHSTWNRMCAKLKQYSDEIIPPCIELLELSEDSLITDEVVQLQEQAEELSKRKYVYCSLCSQGCITTEKLLSLQNEIDIELEEIEKQLTAIDGQGDDMIDELSSLHGLVEKIPPERLSKLILKSAVTDGKTIEFELLGGLKVTEVLA